MPSSTNEWAKAEKEIVQDQQLQEKVTNEEFKIWKKTVPLLYDLIHTFALDHPSTIVEWLPKVENVDDDKVEVQFLLSSNTINAMENSLELASITLSSTLIGHDAISVPADGVDTSNFKRITKWKQNSVANALKLSPDGSTALSFNGDGIIHGYNLTSDIVVDYKYHKQSGFALEWIKDNDNNSERFLSGANDSQIALWQLDKPSTPIQLFKSHHGAINDISTSDANIFGSVSDDSTTQIHDLRASSIASGGVGDYANPAIKVDNKFIQNCIKFHPQINTLYATAGKDNVVSLYDVRNYKQPFRKLFGHNDAIRQLEWDWSNPSTLVSCGLDSRVIFWNLENLEEDYSYPDANANSSETSKRKNQQANKPDPCLKYVHGGHVGRINDFAIHPKIPHLFASVGDDRLLEIWKPKTLPVEEEEVDEEQEEEEEQKEEEKEEGQEQKNAGDEEQEKEKTAQEEKEKSPDADAGKSPKDEEDGEEVSSSKDVEMKD
ncbi:hypothetical protein CANMA_000136 [Candida margitis]|uniref:uncharacterized protein n=1 Tax=Candida margitis TaxID=1775924 RepID=UPI0022276C62|nr:uncharacterized protein CANMA_000136 [Candida margitis]KAI5970717.1 hypothetical protein CANMA_000136 [Candida margitis]